MLCYQHVTLQPCSFRHKHLLNCSPYHSPATGWKHPSSETSCELRRLFHKGQVDRYVRSFSSVLIVFCYFLVIAISLSLCLEIMWPICVRKAIKHPPTKLNQLHYRFRISSTLVLSRVDNRKPASSTYITWATWPNNDDGTIKTVPSVRISALVNLVMCLCLTGCIWSCVIQVVTVLAWISHCRWVDTNTPVHERLRLNANNARREQKILSTVLLESGPCWRWRSTVL